MMILTLGRAFGGEAGQSPASHSDSLIEREPSALMIFFQERARRVGLSGS
jgi:hypothetical protein